MGTELNKANNFGYRLVDKSISKRLDIRPQLPKKREAPLKSASNSLGIVVAKLSGSVMIPLPTTNLPSESSSPSRTPITAHTRCMHSSPPRPPLVTETELRPFFEYAATKP